MVWYYSRMSHFTLFHRYSSCTIKEENYTTMDPMTLERTLNDNVRTSEVLFPPAIDATISTTTDTFEESLDPGRDLASLNQSSTFESYLKDENITASNEKQKVLLAT